MALTAGFAEADITPPHFPVRTYFSRADRALDPISAQAAVFARGDTVLAFLSLDVVIVERDTVEEIRRRVARRRPAAACHLMVSATHNHACPAVVDRPGSEKDDAYLDFMMDRGAEAVERAFDARQPAEIGALAGYESRVSFNRRFVRRNGTVISEPDLGGGNGDLLYNEGIIDPTLGVLLVRSPAGRPLGGLVNFACHACHHMGRISAGYPGVLRRKLQATWGRGSVAVFLNGACGNVIHCNFADPAGKRDMETVGGVLADDVIRMAPSCEYSGRATLDARSVQVPVKYREIAGLEENLRHLERFNVMGALIRKGWYVHSLAVLKALRARADHEDAEVQVFRIGRVFLGAVPAEYFAQHALRIKEQSPAAATWVVSLANGWLGYIPHRAAFERRGGHESTWALWSKMAPEAGDQLADAVLEGVRELARRAPEEERDQLAGTPSGRVLTAGPAEEDQGVSV